MSILGNTVVRKEDPKLLTQGGIYVGDIDLGPHHRVLFVTSTMAHAKVVSIDVSAARAIDGVIAVYTASDLDLVPPSASMGDHPTMVQPYLASSVVRYVGEPIVMIVATTDAVAADAAEAIFVDYEPLDVVVSPEFAYEGRVRLFPEEPSNVVMTLGEPTPEEFFADADVVVRATLHNQRLAPVPLEVRALAARVQQDGRLEVFASTQTPHSVRDAVCGALGVPKEQVHVVTPDVGGGFGAKASQYVEEILVAWAAKKLNHPVRWVESRSQNMTGLGHGRAQVQRVALGARRDGSITGYALEVIQDVGAYPMVGVFLPMLTKAMAGGVYDIPKVSFESHAVVTNTTPIVSYRGAGRPEATAAIEYMVDLLATELAMDPAEIRRRNLLRAESFPVLTSSGSTYDVGDYHKVLEMAIEAVDYSSVRKEQEELRKAGSSIALGIGMSVYVEVTNPFPSQEYGAVELTEKGTLLVRSGTSPQGQGHGTSWAMVASEIFGIGIQDVEVITGDTDIVPRGVGTFGSRSLQLGGVAVHLASIEVLESAKKIAAEFLEANPDDLVVRDGVGLEVAGTPTRNMSWTEIAKQAKSQGESLSHEVDFAADSPTYPFGAHIAVVEVDRDTGKVKLRSIVAVDDAGRIVNPLLAEGQIHGGLAQGISQALYEEVAYDEDGNPLTSNLADYAIPSAAELPSYTVLHNETPTHVNPLGVKGIGESGTIGSTPAVHNAVLDALRFYGVSHIEIPTTPRRVWEALRSADK